MTMLPIEAFFKTVYLNLTLILKARGIQFTIFVSTFWPISLFYK